MDLGTFKEKLYRCNPRIYVDMNHRTFSTNKELGSSGIYLRGVGSEPIKTHHVLSGGDVRVSSGDELKTINAYNSSNDEYIGWVTHLWVPEGDIINIETGKVEARGWRTTVNHFIKKGYINKKKAEKVFNFYKSDYDNLNYDQRLEFERKYANSNSRLYS